jgi:hypothetical protein
MSCKFSRPYINYTVLEDPVPLEIPDPVLEEIISDRQHSFYKPLSTCHPAVREALSHSSSPACLFHHRPCTLSLQPSIPLRLYTRQQRPNSSTKSRQKSKSFPPVYSPLQLCLEISISSNSRNLLHISTVQLLYTVKEKGEKPDGNHTPFPMV